MGCGVILPYPCCHGGVSCGLWGYITLSLLSWRGELWVVGLYYFILVAMAGGAVGCGVEPWVVGLYYLILVVMTCTLGCRVILPYPSCHGLNLGLWGYTTLFLLSWLKPWVVGYTNLFLLS